MRSAPTCSRQTGPGAARAIPADLQDRRAEPDVWAGLRSSAGVC